MHNINVAIKSLLVKTAAIVGFIVIINKDIKKANTQDHASVNALSQISY